MPDVVKWVFHRHHRHQRHALSRQRFTSAVFDRPSSRHRHGLRHTRRSSRSGLKTRWVSWRGPAQSLHAAKPRQAGGAEAGFLQDPANRDHARTGPDLATLATRCGFQMLVNHPETKHRVTICRRARRWVRHDEGILGVRVLGWSIPAEPIEAVARPTRQRPRLERRAKSPYDANGRTCSACHDLGDWCNGSTTDSGSVSLGSNPRSPA